MNDERILRSERLRLRPVTMEDAGKFHKYLGTDEIMVRYTNWNPCATLESTREKLENDIEQWEVQGDRCWAIEMDSRVVGSISAYDRSEDGSSIEVGYSVFRPEWGKGIASEAVSLVVDYLFHAEGYKELRAWTHEDNIASSKALQASGFVLESRGAGEFQNSDGTHSDLLHFVCTPESYESAR